MTDKVAYKRGPYKKLYRSKINSEESSDDCETLYFHLEKFREETKERFSKSYNRSKILENIQGLMDMLKKQIAKRPEGSSIQNLEESMQLLLAEVKQLKEQIAAQNTMNLEWNSIIDESV